MTVQNSYIGACHLWLKSKIHDYLEILITCNMVSTKRSVIDRRIIFKLLKIIKKIVFLCLIILIPWIFNYEFSFSESVKNCYLRYMDNIYNFIKFCKSTFTLYHFNSQK